MKFYGITVTACPDGGAGNDLEVVELAFHQGPTFINLCCHTLT